MLNKVPEVTIFFWIIKILATTVGETAAWVTSGRHTSSKKRRFRDTANMTSGSTRPSLRTSRSTEIDFRSSHLA